MQEPLKYFQVNWVDGMKINKNHFIHQENAFNDQIKDSIGLGIHKNNYGLLPPYFGKGSPIKIVINIDNQNSLRVKVFQCRAVTPGGARIEIFEESTASQKFIMPFPETVYELDPSREAVFFIALSVNPFSRVPMGDPDPSEEPPRYPFTMPEIKTHLIPEEEMLQTEMGLYFLLIGKVKMEGGKPELIEDFIPPCTTVSSHPGLMVLHAEFDKFLSQIELDVITILKKIHEKEQSNVLAKVVFSLSEYFMYFLSTSILEFRLRVVDQPPLVMFEFMAKSARVIKNTIDANSAKEIEELLNYFTDWCNLKQGEFENLLTDTINFQYDHSRIQDTAVIMTHFTEVISALFSKLSSLEYIGKKKGTSIFVKEQTVKKSFLAD